MNVNDQMSMGQLQKAEQDIQGAISDGASALNNGNSPNFAATGDAFSVAEVGVSKFAGNMGGHGVQIASAMNEGMSAPGSTASTFFQPGKKSKRLVDGFGLDMSYRDIRQLARRESKMLAHIAKTGRMPQQTDKDGVFRAAPDVFDKGKGPAEVTIGPGGFMPRALKITAQMMINLGLVPKALKDSLDEANRLQSAPGTNQIVNGLKDNEQSGEDLFRKATPTVQDTVLDSVSDDAKKKLAPVEQLSSTAVTPLKKAGAPYAPKPPSFAAHQGDQGKN